MTANQDRAAARGRFAFLVPATGRTFVSPYAVAIDVTDG
jgi:hypothetical protein